MASPGGAPEPRQVFDETQSRLSGTASRNLCFRAFVGTTHPMQVETTEFSAIIEMN